MSRPRIELGSQELASCAITARPPQHDITGPRYRAFDVFQGSCYNTNSLALSTDWRLHCMTGRLLLHVSTTFQKHSIGSGTRVSWPNFIILAFVDKLMPGLNATCQTAANPSALTTPRPPGSLCQLGYHRVTILWLVSSSFKFLSMQRQGGSPIGGSP